MTLASPAADSRAAGPCCVPRVAILTNVVPSYREGFYDRLFARSDIAVDVYCQAHLPGVNVKTIHGKYPARVHLVPALSAPNEALVWQRTPWRQLFGYDVVFVSGNPRVVSHAVAATLLRLTRRHVVLWTMGHSFGARGWTEWLRLRWTRIFPRIFVYTDAEVRALRKRGFTSPDISAMNNGLDQANIDRIAASWTEDRLEAWRRANGLDGRTTVLSCTRLNAKNRLDLVVRALPTIVARIPDLLWCVVGAGEERGRLESLLQQEGLARHARFAGELYDEGDLAPWFLSAKLLVHPAAIGLTLLHAFGYGLPVVTDSLASGHGPEFGAFEEGRTGRSFREGDVGGLAASVVGLLENEAVRDSMSLHVRDIVRHQYNVDVMVERFVQAARRASGACRGHDGSGGRSEGERATALPQLGEGHETSSHHRG
jgi:glycosyltransferase involved in cell wall biosynthesis